MTINIPPDQKVQKEKRGVQANQGPIRRFIANFDRYDTMSGFGGGALGGLIVAAAVTNPPGLIVAGGVVGGGALGIGAAKVAKRVLA